MRAKHWFGIDEINRTFDGCLFAKSVTILVGTATGVSTQIPD